MQQLCCRSSLSVVAPTHYRMLLWLTIHHSALLSSSWLPDRCHTAAAELCCLKLGAMLWYSGLQKIGSSKHGIIAGIKLQLR